MLIEMKNPPKALIDKLYRGFDESYRNCASINYFEL